MKLSVYFFSLILVFGFESFTNCCDFVADVDHYWIESTEPFRYIRIDEIPSADLGGWSEELDHEFKFRTKIYHCIDGFFYMKTSVLLPTRYLHNDNIGDDVDVSTVDDEAPGPSNGRFFKYNNPFLAMEYTSLGSEVSQSTKYVERNGGLPMLHLVPYPYYWITIPYVGRDLHVMNRRTQILSSLDINNNNLAVAAFMNQDGKLEAETFTAQPPNTGRYRFEPLSYRYYKRITSNGTLVISQAVVLKKSGTERYIAVNRDANGAITLPFTLTSPTGGTVRYNEIDLIDYRGRNATFIHPSDVSSQTVIDERFFEVLPQQGTNTYRLVSTLHPDRYLAVIRRGRRAIMAIAELSSLPTTSINYDFTLDLPGPPTSIRRLPDFPECTLSPRDKYTVNGQFCTSNSRVPN